MLSGNVWTLKLQKLRSKGRSKRVRLKPSAKRMSSEPETHRKRSSKIAKTLLLGQLKLSRVSGQGNFVAEAIYL
ncbi:hypothetical protein BN949_05664 [Agrobacterium tumefaciens]|nr:hypothetical protein BN949_05664 [Agrobacterium tumefaciens]